MQVCCLICMEIRHPLQNIFSSCSLQSISSRFDHSSVPSHFLQNGMVLLKIIVKTAAIEYPGFDVCIVRKCMYIHTCTRANTRTCAHDHTQYLDLPIMTRPNLDRVIPTQILCGSATNPRFFLIHPISASSPSSVICRDLTVDSNTIPYSLPVILMTKIYFIIVHGYNAVLASKQW